MIDSRIVSPAKPAAPASCCGAGGVGDPATPSQPQAAPGRTHDELLDATGVPRCNVFRVARSA
jgi:hypothetical protein